MPRLRVIDDEVIERPFDKRQFLRLLQFLKPYRKPIAFSLFLMVTNAVCSLALPMLMSRAIDEIDVGNASSFPQFLIAMVVCAAVGSLCVRYRARIMDTAGRSAIADMREALFNHIQDLSFNFFDSRSAGKIMVRVINDINSLNDLFTNGIVNVLIDCFTLILLIVIMLAVNWKLTLIAMCILPFLLLILFKLKRKIRLRWQKVRVKTSSMNGYLHESLAGMRVTEAFVREEENDDTFRNVNDDIRSSWMHAIQRHRRADGGALQRRAGTGQPLADPVVSGPVLGAAQHAFELLQQHSFRHGVYGAHLRNYGYAQRHPG